MPPDLQNESDDFEAYRQIVEKADAVEKLRSIAQDSDEEPGCYLEEDVAALEGFQDMFPMKQGSRLIISGVESIPFDNDPLPAVRYLVARVFQRIQEMPHPDKERAVIPFLVPLNKDVGMPASIDEEITARIQQGLGEWGEEHGDCIDGNLLRDVKTIRRMLLIVYSGKSTEVVQDFSGEQERIQKLLEFVRIKGKDHPVLAFVASDLHHEDLVNQTLNQRHNN